MKAKSLGKTRSNQVNSLPAPGKRVRLPFVKSVKSKGRIYRYFKSTDGLTRLPDEPAAFAASYAKLVREKEMPQSISSLIAAYERSPEYARLKDSSKGVYDSCFRDLHRQHAETEIDGFAFGELERFAQTAKSKGTATTYIKVVSALFSWARGVGLASHNPADGMIARRRGEQWIYFIGAGSGEPVKIGRTSSIKKRLAAIQGGNHRPLRVLASFRSNDPLVAERGYHTRFAEHRLHGEWFAPHPDILAEIERLSTPHDKES